MPCSWQTTLAPDVSVPRPNSRRLPLCHLMQCVCVCMQMCIPSLFMPLQLHKQRICLFSAQVLNVQLFLAPLARATPSLQLHLLPSNSRPLQFLLTGSFPIIYELRSIRMKPKDQQLACQWAANPQGVSDMGTSSYGLSIRTILS